jgi:hypothetical protein
MFTQKPATHLLTLIIRTALSFGAIALLLTGCKDQTAEQKLKLGAQWGVQTRAVVAGDKNGFENILCTLSRAQTQKVDWTFGIASGLAKTFKLTEGDLRIDDISFNKELTQALVKTASRNTKSASINNIYNLVGSCYL